MSRHPFHGYPDRETTRQLRFSDEETKAGSSRLLQTGEPGSMLDAGLIEDVLYVRFHCKPADVQPSTDLIVGEALASPSERD